MAMSIEDRFGTATDRCPICNARLDEIKEMKIEVKHRASDTVMAQLWYAIPLCDACRDEKNPVRVEISWEKLPIKVENILPN